MHACDDTRCDLYSYPFDSFDWPPSLLRALDTHFSALERRMADDMPPRAVCLPAPEGRHLHLELTPDVPVLYVLARPHGEAQWEDDGEPPMQARSWLRVWRGPGDGLAPRDIACLREAGLEPLRDGVCFPEKHLASMQWEDVMSSELQLLVEATRWSARVLEDGGRCVA